MKKKYLITAVCSLLIMLMICGCKQDVSKPETLPTEDTVTYNTSFSNMPKMAYENVITYVSGDTAIFEYINPGLDSFEAEAVSYSLSEDKVLGQISLGEGDFQISLVEDGFAVVDLLNHTADFYDETCSKINSVTVFENSMLSFAKVSFDGKYILAQNYANDDLLIYNSESKNTVTLSKGKTFEKAEYYNGRFYLLGAGAYVLEPENNHFYGISDVIRTYDVGGNYIAGSNSSYIVLLSTESSNHKMINVDDRPGYLIDVSDYGCITIDYTDGKSLATFYDTKSFGVSEYSQEGMIIDAEQISASSAIIVTKNADNAIDYRLLDISSLHEDNLEAEELNEDKINGVAELPDYSGNAQTVEITKQLENNYGVRVLYCEDIFDTNGCGYEITGTDEETAYYYMQMFGDYFDYYPQGLLKDAGLGRPLVIFLCDNIKNNVSGLSTYIMGYNIIYMQVGGKDEYFFSSLTHEIGHALENGIDAELTGGWTELMPEEVIKAYGDGIEGISVEYTPDDKGRTPVWFRDVYGRSNEKEDRATIFQEMYDSYIDNNIGMFEYEGLRKKADYWSYMLRETYDSCKNVDKFNWEI
ncbi:MAG: hypothetical protein ACI4GZ_00020 [Ruminococcus sp.]